jgi:Predicted membrane protein
MHIVWTILIGFVVGLVAKLVTPGRDPSGFFITAAIGIAGSLLATYGGQAMGLYSAGEPAGFFGSLVGAIILLVIYHLFTRKSTPSV